MLASCSPGPFGEPWPFWITSSLSTKNTLCNSSPAVSHPQCALTVCGHSEMCWKTRSCKIFVEESCGSKKEWKQYWVWAKWMNTETSLHCFGFLLVVFSFFFFSLVMHKLEFLGLMTHGASLIQVLQHFLFYLISVTVSSFCDYNESVRKRNVSFVEKVWSRDLGYVRFPFLLPKNM